MIESRSGCQRPKGWSRVLNTKDHKTTFWDNGNTLYYDCGVVYMILNICQNSSNFKIKIESYRQEAF